jgi:hypothetical protein
VSETSCPDAGRGEEYSSLSRCSRLAAVGSPTSSSSPDRIQSVLAAVLQRLEEAPDTPHTRELRAQARVCEKAVRHWNLTAPSEPQVDAMHHLVTELHLIACGASRAAS